MEYVGWLKSYGDDKNCQCGNDIWRVLEDVASDELMWECTSCNRRLPINRTRLHGRYPKRMQLGTPPLANS